MRNHTKYARLLLAAFLVLAASAAYWIVQAGSLEPPGPPAPTMKTLDEVEPRIPIHASDLPLTIMVPGSYYLAEDIVTAGAGITIDTDNVTIDLMGYSLVGGTGTGIFADALTKNVAVRNGTLSGWQSAGVSLFGLNSQVDNLRAEANGGGGITTGEGSTITNCVSRENNIGISAGSGSTVIGSTAGRNNLDGITVTHASLVVNCTAWVNDRYGIFATGSGNLIRGNTVRFSGEHGIRVFNVDAFIVGNYCTGNGRIGVGAGIHVPINGSHIEGNTVTNNDFGILVQFGGNVILKNTASGNASGNYSIVAGNSFGPLVNVAGVGDISGTANADHPWANFEY